MYKVNLLDLAEELGISPLSVPKELFIRQCQRKITYEADTECFCIEVFRIARDVSRLAETVLGHMRRVEDNFLSKLSAAYILCRKSSYPSVEYILKRQNKDAEGRAFIAEQLQDSSNLIHKLNNQYFDSIEGRSVTITPIEKCEELLAGSENEKEIISPIARFVTEEEKAEAAKDVWQVLRTCGDNTGRSDILKILVGVSTNKIKPTAYSG
eukprot:TRINITY_DN7535_c0_g1_i3.p2 TRINITY_DN7535_c0_g1~~TRINITY_DN7535_c0_g1_i3.p2  ORF type:complete len:211 (+),score=69.57 TRINITY_DN7535_c0_g1_i3:772-1404(+)